MTCLQFNPVEEKSFITGCIDGKVRIWHTYDAHVVDWLDAKDIVTAVCYGPDGNVGFSFYFFFAAGSKLFLLKDIGLKVIRILLLEFLQHIVVGLITGNCRFYTLIGILLLIIT